VRVFGERPKVIAAYDPVTGTQGAAAIHTIALVDRVRTDDLTALLTVIPAWHKARLATPLLLAEEEFDRTLDVFPLEYQSILSRHVIIRGAYLETHGRPAAIAELIRASLPAFRAALQNIARLHASPAVTDDQLVTFSVSTLAVDGPTVRDVLAFSGGGTTTDAPVLFPRYVDLVERLWRTVDRNAA
jgi:hypothetical protein